MTCIKFTLPSSLRGAGASKLHAHHIINMMLVLHELYLLILVCFLLKTVAAEGEADANFRLSSLGNGVSRRQEETPEKTPRLARLPETGSSSDLTNHVTLTSEETPLRNPIGFYPESPVGSRGLAKKDEGSNNFGWGFLSSISSTLNSQQPTRRRKPIDDIPILGSLVSLGETIGLAGRRSANLLKDGSRRFGDLAVGTFTKSGFKYPLPDSATDGLASAVGGVGELSSSDLITVASALSKSKGRVDFVQHLLDESTPETAFRLGLAAAAINELKSNPVLGPAAGLLKQFVKRK